MNCVKRIYKDLTIFACELNGGLVSVEAQKTNEIGFSGQKAIYGGERIYKANGDLHGAIACFVRNVIEGGAKS